MIENPLDVETSGMPPVGFLARQTPDIIDIMSRVLRFKNAEFGGELVKNKLNVATILTLEGFTASDIVEHIDEVILRVAA